MYKILIPVDGSKHADRAIGAVARLAEHVASIDVVLINVQEGWVFHGELPPLEYKSLEEMLVVQQNDLLENALAHARSCGLKSVICEAARGLVASEIIGAAALHAVDQIAMGTHGRGAVGSLFIGSVAQQVVHLAQMPVLLVK